MDIEQQLREKAKGLLEAGEVKLVIGYGSGSTRLKCTPMFVESAEDAEKLVWTPACVNNLAVYLPEAVKYGKVAVIVKPCDAKSVIELIREHQIKREDVYIIALGCPGVIDADALAGFDPRDVKSVGWRDGGIVVVTDKGETVLPADKSLSAKCLSCELADPAFADAQIGQSPTRSPKAAERMTVEQYEAMSPIERREFWGKQFEKCIRCYACRSVCPGCYCKECFVDKPSQLWASKTTGPSSNWFFHMTRAMHTAGRCIGCGECERACPMAIPLSLLGRKLDDLVEEMFESTPGENPEAVPVLGCYTDKDPDPCPE